MAKEATWIRKNIVGVCGSISLMVIAVLLASFDARIVAGNEKSAEADKTASSALQEVKSQKDNSREISNDVKQVLMIVKQLQIEGAQQTEQIKSIRTVAEIQMEDNRREHDAIKERFKSMERN